MICKIVLKDTVLKKTHELHKNRIIHFECFFKHFLFILRTFILKKDVFLLFFNQN